MEGILQEEETSPFITEVIKRIDTNGNKKIDHFELRNSYNASEVSHILSRMVCKHKSEWSYKWAKIKSDYEKFIKYHYPKAKQEYVNERLDEIQAKYDAFYDFWAVLKEKDILKTDTFWYFEPFAWVEQMKRVFERKEIKKLEGGLLNLLIKSGHASLLVEWEKEM